MNVSRVHGVVWYWIIFLTIPDLWTVNKNCFYFKMSANYINKKKHKITVWFSYLWKKKVRRLSVLVLKAGNWRKKYNEVHTPKDCDHLQADIAGVCEVNIHDTRLSYTGPVFQTQILTNRLNSANLNTSKWIKLCHLIFKIGVKTFSLGRRRWNLADNWKKTWSTN